MFFFGVSVFGVFPVTIFAGTIFLCQWFRPFAIANGSSSQLWLPWFVMVCYSNVGVDIVMSLSS